MAAEAGRAALAALADNASPLGGGLAGDVDDEAAASAHEDAQSAYGDAAEEAEGDGLLPPIAAAGGASPRPAGPPPAAYRSSFGVSAELAAIAQEADPVLGPRIVRALAESRRVPSMQRAYVRHLEVATIGQTLEALGPALNDPDRTRFRELAGCSSRSWRWSMGRSTRRLDSMTCRAWWQLCES